MHQFRRFFILAVLQLLSSVCLFGIDSKGAIIIANIVGEVEVLNNATQTPLSSDKVITGGVLFDGHTIKAGKGSKAILLMSSGTILTVRENSSINLKKFAQEPFTPGDKKLSELKSEPSPSETTVEVEKGDLIFNIKKLDKNSNFDIESPLGTAGIRGTAGSAGTDKLTLTEGAVQITPIGGGVPVPLGAGQTIAPAPGGGLNTQPASAEDMNSINSENAEAESNTADVSMEDAASAQSEVEEESAAEEEAAAEEEPAEEEAAEEEPAEEEAAEEEAAEEEAAEEEAAEEEAPAEEEAAAEEEAPAEEEAAPAEEEAPAEEPESAPEEEAPADEPAPVSEEEAPAEEPSAPAEPEPAAEPEPTAPEEAPPAEQASAPVEPEAAPVSEQATVEVAAPSSESIRESDPTMREKQKGNDDLDAKEAAIKSALMAAGVDEDQASAGASFIGESSDTDNFQINLDDIKNSTADELKEAAENVSSGIDPAVADALKRLKRDFPSFSSLFEKYKDHAIGILELVSSQSTKARQVASLNDQVFALYTDAENSAFFEEEIGVDDGDAFRDLLIDDPVFFSKFLPALKKNPSLPPLLFAELSKLSLTDSELNEVLSDVGEGPGDASPSGTPPATSSLNLSQEAEMLHLLQDRKISPETLDESLFISSNNFVASVFFDDVVQAYAAMSQLEDSLTKDTADPVILDSIDSIQNFSKVSSDSQSDSTEDETFIFGGRNVSLSGGKYPVLKTPALIAASEKLTLLGDLVFQGDEKSELTFLSSGSIDTTDLTSISHPGKLGFGSFASLNIENVSLTASEIHLRSLDSIILKNTDLVTNSTGVDFIHLMAVSEINAEQLSIQTREIIMSAMTINLIGVNFPSDSIVELNSAYGGIGGKYPNFGSKQYGRVNFIEGVRYGESLINSASAFDATGVNISIGKL